MLQANSLRKPICSDGRPGQSLGRVSVSTRVNGKSVISHSSLRKRHYSFAQPKFRRRDKSALLRVTSFEKDVILCVSVHDRMKRRAFVLFLRVRRFNGA